jgi:hypothetical protein
LISQHFDEGVWHDVHDPAVLERVNAPGDFRADGIRIDPER